MVGHTPEETDPTFFSWHWLPKASLLGRNLMSSSFICVWILISLMLCMPFPGNHRCCRFIMAMEDTQFFVAIFSKIWIRQYLSLNLLLVGWLVSKTQGSNSLFQPLPPLSDTRLVNRWLLIVTLSLYMGSGDLNSGLQPYAAYTLATEPYLISWCF